FLEAIRQFRHDVGRENAIFMHLTLMPYIAAAGELKSKPTQHSVRELMQIGIQPDVLILRSEHPISDDVKRKIALFCNVEFGAVVESPDVRTIYEIPLRFHEQGLDKIVLQKFGIEGPAPALNAWRELVQRVLVPHDRVRIAIVGKYTDYADSYKSVQEALIHGGIANDVGVDIQWMSSDNFSSPDRSAQILAGVDGVLVPGGFGVRGVEGMVEAIRHVRENGVPFFGICLGMQLAAIEFARNVCGLKGSTSTEFQKDCPNPIIDLMPDQRGVKDKGGTMRLGAYPCALKPGSHAFNLYKKDEISERHRHRFEFNNEYREQLMRAGLVLSGTSPDDRLVEIIELPEHRYFVGCQFHPEFKSRPMSAHPLFQGFVAAASQRRDEIAASARTEAAQTESTTTVN
ncbi:MAG TPA: CTP synthase, partial [Polyangiales bacterium]|nr:CTP synthase [Polyangiales bacterium]